MTKQERELKEIQDQIAALSESIRNIASESGEDALQKVQSKVESVRQKFDDVREKGSEIAKKTNDYVHENPWQMLAGAAALGLLAGLLLRSRDK